MQPGRQIEPGITEFGPYYNTEAARGGYFVAREVEFHWYEEAGHDISEHFKTREWALQDARDHVRHSEQVIA
ncbi:MULTISPECIES: hypothetical protein [unclassified Caballeronia]|uniref:hypothetical protein n=1 Tax=unclassified Caballeronia TaxID=2646786 RepID=UPI002857072F|nr:MULTISPECIES: hypothetical protein [unclassified Caballeronia]MDR5775580.1 hypothetical protein [Caballeronia sp. LZ002]MDR5801893.1 hypothetical protein [Caballeronia sp. LZ001]MDR5851018.1 hypothetical protein [Caballeronia sp. LZ003]